MTTPPPTPLLRPGTVFVTRSSGWAARLIRLGAALLGKPNLHNHVALYHHTTDGVPWGIEGRPGGVGWVDMRRYLKDKHTIDNRDQPDLSRSDGAAIAASMEALLGTKYDWVAITDATRAALHLPDLWREDWHGQGVPGQMVCSSAAAYFYGTHGFARPGNGDERHVKPADWTEHILLKQWAAA